MATRLLGLGRVAALLLACAAYADATDILGGGGATEVCSAYPGTIVCNIPTPDGMPQLDGSGTCARTSPLCCPPADCAEASGGSIPDEPYLCDPDDPDCIPPPQIDGGHSGRRPPVIEPLSPVPQPSPALPACPAEEPEPMGSCDTIGQECAYGKPPSFCYYTCEEIMPGEDEGGWLMLCAVEEPAPPVYPETKEPGTVGVVGAPITGSSPCTWAPKPCGDKLYWPGCDGQDYEHNCVCLPCNDARVQQKRRLLFATAPSNKMECCV